VLICLFRHTQLGSRRRHRRGAEPTASPAVPSIGAHGLLGWRRDRNCSAEPARVQVRHLLFLDPARKTIGLPLRIRRSTPRPRTERLFTLYPPQPSFETRLSGTCSAGPGGPGACARA
jgi:hypothetical protein